MELLIDKCEAGRENFRFNGHEIKLLGDIIAIGRDETELAISEEKWICIPTSNMKTRMNNISDILERWRKRHYFPAVFARSLAAKTYLSLQLMHLFSNATLDEQCMKKIQNKIDKYVNKKEFTSRNTTYLAFRDGGTGTCSLYHMYLASKVTWIAKLMRQHELTKHYKNYRIPPWADSVIKTLRSYGVNIAHLNILGSGDIELIALVLKREGLTFWAGVFYEYAELLGIADIDGEIDRRNKSDKMRKAQPYCSSWMNHVLIGSKYIQEIKYRNKQVKIGNMEGLFNTKSLSIVNPRLHPVLDIGCGDMGSHVSRTGGEEIIPNSFKNSNKQQYQTMTLWKTKKRCY